MEQASTPGEQSQNNNDDIEKNKLNLEDLLKSIDGSELSSQDDKENEQPNGDARNQYKPLFFKQSKLGFDFNKPPKQTKDE